MERQYITVAEVAKVFGVSKAAIYALAASGQLPSIRLGRTVRIPASVVDGPRAEPHDDMKR